MHTLKAGDKVKFVRARSHRTGFNLKLLYGEVIDVSKPYGLKVRVRYHAGNTCWILATNAVHADQPSPLNALLETPKSKQ